MKILEFHEVLNNKGYEFSYIDGVTIISHDGIVWLRYLTSLPENVEFSNGGDVDLESLTSLPENTRFNNRGFVFLRSLTSLPENTKFNNSGGVYLNSLTSMSENIMFNNGGVVWLRPLTTLPENVSFNNVGGVYLDSLNNQQIKYKNKEFTYKYVDSIPMLIGKSHKFGDIVVSSGYIFKGGDLEKLEAIYIAEKDEFSAHGKTAKLAIEDLNFKILSENFDVSEVVDEIKSTNKITKTQYRLLTGACDVGVELFKKENNITSDEIDLSKAIELTKGQYGHDRLVELVG